MFSIRRFFSAFYLVVSLPVLILAKGVTVPLAENTQPAETPRQAVEARMVEMHPDYLLLEFDFPEISWTQGKDSIPDLPGLLHIQRSGEPQLPFSTHIVQIPPGKLSVRILQSESGQYKVKRIPPYFGNSPASSNIPSTIYRRNAYHPAEAVSVKKMGNFQGRELASITINPLQYNPVKEEVLFTRKIRVRIDFQKTVSIPGRSLSGGAARTLAGLLHEFPQTSLYPCAPSTPPPVISNNIGQSGGIKIAVSQEGLYRITYQALTDSGIDPADLGDPRNFNLSNRDEIVPIYVYGEADGVFNAGDYIDFWGIPNRLTEIEKSPDLYTDPWSDVNIYWLTFGNSPGGHMMEESVEIVQNNPAKYYRPYNYRTTVHFESNNYFDRLTQVQRDTVRDHWYFDVGTDANETSVYNFHLPYPETVFTTEPAELKAMLMGYTYAVSSGSQGIHLAVLSLDNYSSFQMTAGAPVNNEYPWMGQNLWIVEASGSGGIPNSYLRNGNNTLSLSSSGTTPSGNSNTVLLNWFEVTYTKKYLADGGYIRFTAPPDSPVDTVYHFIIENFPTDEVILYKMGSSRLLNYEMYQNPISGLYRMTMQDRLFGGEEYVALTADSVKAPDWIELDEVSDLTSPANQAEYLIIAHRDFQENASLQSALQQNSTNGSMMVNVQDIYDEFNYGIQSPEAIKSFLEYAYHYWAEPKPYYIVLAGDGSWDQKDRFGEGGNLIPSYYVQTMNYGYSASDYWFTLLEGNDFIPEVCLGRIPARENEEIDAYYGKYLQNENEPVNGTWRNKYLFISGRDTDPLEDLEEKAEQAISMLPHWIFVERLSTGNTESPFFGGNSELQEFFNGGCGIMSYNGHGGGGVWDDNNIMDVPRVANLQNEGLYPFIANFTCYICQYDVKEWRSTLGEEFVFAEDKGALGVFGSTGLGWGISGGELQQSMSNALTSGAQLMQGDLMNISKILFLGAQFGSSQSFLDNLDYATMMNMILLGDPSAKLAMPTEVQQIIQFPVVPGDVTLSLPVQAPFFPGEAVARIYNQFHIPMMIGGSIWEYGPVSFNSANFNFDINPTITGLPSEGSIRIDLYSETDIFNTAAYFDFFNQDSINGAVYDSLTTVPEIFTDVDSLKFYCRIYDPDTVATAYILYQVRNGSIVVIEDSVDLIPLDADKTMWESAVLPPFSGYVNYTLWFPCKSIDNLGNLTNSYAETPTIYDHHIDFSVTAPDVVLTGTDKIKVSAIIKNLTVITADSVLVQFWAGQGKERDDLIGIAWAKNVNIAFPSTVEIIPSIPFDDGEYHLEVMIDPYNAFDDLNYDNNSADTTIIVDHFETNPVVGTNLGGLSSLFHYGNYTFKVMPNSVADTTLLIASLSDTITTSLPGISVYDSSEALNLSFTTQPPELQNPSGLLIYVLFTLGDSADLDSLHLHRRQSNSSIWEELTTTFMVDTGGYYRATAICNELGSFVLMKNFDNMPPTVEVSVDGQDFSQGGYVPSRPRISALFQDIGGIDPASFWVTVDADTVEQSLISLPVLSENNVSSTISIHELFPPGEHTVIFGGSDLSGNLTAFPVEIVVASGFDFRFVSNYPNPFSDETLITYSLTDQPDGEIEMKVYTVSGRHIRTLSQAAKINYDEVFWDGRDEEGNNIANGVYFCKVTAHKGDKKRQKIIKIAKVRA